MFTRLIAAFSLTAMVMVANPAPVAPAPAANIHASLITFSRLTRVCDAYLFGSYIVVHDDEKMSRGEPCTTFYKTKSPGLVEPIVSFHCIPRERSAVKQTTITTRPATGPTPQSVELVEYQIGGETEAHGVPALK